jgi:hypothetical protein
VKHRRTIFLARVGPVWFSKKACQDMLHPTCVFAAGVTPTFYKNKIFVHIGVHIKCISNCSAYENFP